MNLSLRMNKEVIGISLLVIADAAAFISANNPSMMTTRTFTTAGGNKAENVRGDITLGLKIATAETVLVALGASLVVDSGWPLLTAVAYLASKWWLYVWALNHPHDSAEPMDNQSGSSYPSSMFGMSGMLSVN